MWQSKYLPTPIVQIVPGEYPPFAPVVGTNNRGIPGVCPDVGVGKYPGNTPFLGYLPGIPPRSGRNRFQIPRVRPGVFPGYSPGTICTMGVGRYFDCHIRKVGVRKFALSPFLRRACDLYSGAQETGVTTGVSFGMGCTLRIMIAHF